MTLPVLLQNVGFSEKEAHVYLSALASGTAPASQIAEHCGMKRITTYEILKKMSLKGVVFESDQSGITHFTALSPSRLFSKIEKNIADLKEKKTYLESLMTEQSVRPQVRFLHGIEGIRQGYEETLETSKEILSIANSKNIRSHWKEYDKEYVQKRSEKKIFLRGIAPKDTIGEKVQKDDRKCFRETRLIERDLFPPEIVENEICIFDDTVLIASFQPDVFAIVITSSAVMQTQKQIFELLWKIAEHTPQ